MPLFYFSTTNLDGLTKATSRTSQICEAGRVWLNSDTEETLREEYLFQFEI